MSTDTKKPWLEHLEELRRRMLYCALSVVLLSVLSYIFSGRILAFLTQYVNRLTFISPQEAFLAHVKISLLSGAVLSAPVILFNALRFVWKALKKKERSVFFVTLAASLVLFAGGALFAFYVALPTALKFLLGFASERIRPFITVSNYILFCAFLILAFAATFEIPLFVVLLTRLGLINAGVLRQKRKYVVVALFVLAAILTPPDVVTQLLLVVPLLVLFEISILLSAVMGRKK